MPTITMLSPILALLRESCRIGGKKSLPLQARVFTVKAGEKGIPASGAGNAGTTVDVAVTAQTVYADDKISQFPQQYGPSPVGNFLSVEYP